MPCHTGGPPCWANRPQQAAVYRPAFCVSATHLLALRVLVWRPLYAPYPGRSLHMLFAACMPP